MITSNTIVTNSPSRALKGWEDDIMNSQTEAFHRSSGARLVSLEGRELPLKRVALGVRAQGGLAHTTSR